MLGEVIKIKLNSLLKAQGKTLYSLAKETGISYNALWKISNGKVQGITFDVLERLCLNLNCTAGDLLEVKK